MEYMFAKGFLGTRAPFFMDFITLIVTLLPLFVAIGILFARRYDYEIHALIQMSIFILSLVIFGYFEYGVRLGGGFFLLLYSYKNMVLSGVECQGLYR